MRLIVSEGGAITDRTRWENEADAKDSGCNSVVCFGSEFYNWDNKFFQFSFFLNRMLSP